MHVHRHWHPTHIFDRAPLYPKAVVLLIWGIAALWCGWFWYAVLSLVF